MIVAKRQFHEFSPCVQELLEIGSQWHMEQHGDEFGAFLEWMLSDSCPHRILEIGVRRGGTAATWCSLPDYPYVVGVDLPSETEHLHSLRTRFSNFVAYAGDSHSEETRRWIEGCKPFDLVFLDGDHSLRGVARDFVDYEPMIERHGLVVFHDIVDTPLIRNAGHGVYKFWNDLSGDKTEFLIGDGQWGGIGVWRKT